MATGFHHTLRTLRADGFGRSLASIAVVALLLSAWATWCVRGKISLYETSTNARLEIDRAAYAVQSPLSGNVTGMGLAIGREVKRGDVLFELDSRAEELQREEERSRLGAMEREIDALRSQIAIEEKARLDEQRMAGMAEEVARANAGEAEALAGQAAAEAARGGGRSGKGGPARGGRPAREGQRTRHADPQAGDGHQPPRGPGGGGAFYAGAAGP
jgi:membrane fusion protein (multidrug efflux system)